MPFTKTMPITQLDWKPILASQDVNTLIELSLAEDIGTGDITTASIFSGPQIIETEIVARTKTVVCGLPLAHKIFHQLDPQIEFPHSTREGAIVEAGDTLLTICGDVRPILTGERTVLNFLMRLCAIAFNAHQATQQIPDQCQTQIFDTRKTTPGWRRLEKAAVSTGGAQNHRFGLFDAILIKDNHIASAGSIEKAVQMVRETNKQSVLLEIEIDELHQLDQALAARPDIILLDNFSLHDLETAVKRTAGACILEASGGITLNTIKAIALTGVNRISMGSLTHTIQPADLGLDMSCLPPTTSDS